MVKGPGSESAEPANEPGELPSWLNDPVLNEPGRCPPAPVIPVREIDGKEGTLGSDDIDALDTLAVPLTRDRIRDFSLSPENSLRTSLMCSGWARWV